MTKRRHIIQELRNALGYKQDHMARLLGVSRSLLASIETGKKPLLRKHADNLAGLTGLDPEWLLENNRKKPPLFLEHAVDPSIQKFVLNPGDYRSADEFLQKNWKSWLRFESKEDDGRWQTHVFWWLVIRLITAAWSAECVGKSRFFTLRLARIVEEIESEFGSHEETRAALCEAVECGGQKVKPWRIKAVLQIQALSKVVSAIFKREEKTK